MGITKASLATDSWLSAASFQRSTGALRPETVVSDTRDFGVGRRVTAENWKALRAVGEKANQRLCDAQASHARPAPDVAAFTQVTRGRPPTMANTPPRCRSGTRG
jgi:hypothetical protein